MGAASEKAVTPELKEFMRCIFTDFPLYETMTASKVRVTKHMRWRFALDRYKPVLFDGEREREELCACG